MPGIGIVSMLSALRSSSGAVVRETSRGSTERSSGLEGGGAVAACY